MIPKLYQKDGTTLIGTLTNCIECLVEEERNGIFEVTFQYPNTESIATSLVYDNIVICDANDTLKNQKFRIYDTRRMMNNTIEVYARHISFDLAYDHIDSIDITNQSCEYALNTIFRNSQFSTGYKGHSDIVNAQNYKISNCNALEAIAGKQGSIIDTYGTGAEILRDNIDIYVYNKRGNDNGVSIEYAKNLTGFELQENTDDLITRILPYASYTPEGGTQTRIDGPSCDSQYITNYSHPFITEIDFSDKFEDNEVPTASKLQTLAEQYFNNNKCDLPKQNWKIEFIPLSKCVGYEGIEDAISLCDTVTIKDTRYNINTKAKVIKTVFDVLRERYDSMELGEPRTTLGDIVNAGSEKGEQGPPGPQGPKGEDGSIGDFPDSLPDKPTLTATLLGFASIQLDWTYENKSYYWYEVYASREKNFTPNVFDIVHKGQTSSFLYQAKPGQTWYFRVCGINSHDHRGSFSDQIEVVTTKVDNLENYFTTAAIGQAVVGSLTADYMTAGIIKGYWIDAKNLSVTDGNGKRTLDIDSFGNVNLDVTSLKIASSNVATQSYTNTTIADSIKDLEIGGTNLLKYTDFSTDKCLDKWLGYYNTTNSTTLTYIESNKAIRVYSDTFEADTAVGIMNKTYISLKGGQKYTLSFNAISSSWTTNLDYCYLINNDDGGTNQRIPGVEIAPSTANIDNSRVSITFTPNVDIAKCRILIAANDETVETHKKGFQIKNIKLERGIKATDWSPMPSDTAEVITEVVSNTNSSINQKAGEILSTVSNTYATKKSVTDLTNNLTNNYSTTNSMNTAIDQKAGEILSTVNNTYSTKTELNSLSIGGRNLVLNTAFEGADYGGTDVPKWSCSNNVFIHQSSQGLPQGIYISNRTLNGDGSSGMYYQYIDNTKVKRNSTYTLSYYISVQTNVTRAVVQMRYYDADGNIIGRNTLGDYSGGESGTKTHTFKTLDDAYDRCALVIAHFGVNNDNVAEQYSIRIQRIMLEQSTKASQWTPAPEDVDDKFTKYSTTVEMNTAIDQSAKSITLAVDKTYAKTDTVASTYATNTALVDMEKNITSSVSSTYAKKTDVSNTYATKTALTNLGNDIRNEVSSTYLSQGDANNTYATKSSLTQTENNLTLKFSSTGGYNMVRNSSFKNGTTLWAGQSDAKLILYQYNGTQCVRVVTTVDETTGATGIKYNGNDIDIIQNRYYSLSFKMRSYSNVNTTDMKYNYITNSTSGNKKMSDQDEYRFSYQSVGGGYYRIKISFKATETLTGSGLIIGFTGVSNSTANTTGFGITEVMFQEGQECMGWTPHPSEVYDGIVAIDKDGIQVTSGNSNVQTLMNNNGLYVRKPSGDTYNYLLKANADGLSISEGIVNIDKTGVKVTHSNGDYTKMESGGFKRYVGGTGKSYHYLMSVGTVNVRTGQTATVQLPNEFKGKSFQVIIAAFKVNIVSGWDSIYDIDSYATNKNTTNGTFEIVGMVNSSNGKEGTLDVSYVVIA